MTALLLKVGGTALAGWMFIQSAHHVRRDDPMPALGWAAGSGVVLTLAWRDWRDVVPNWRDADWLLGRRFVTDFRVLAIGPRVFGNEDDRTVTLDLYGQRFTVSYGELRTIIEAGFVVETGMDE